MIDALEFMTAHSFPLTRVSCSEDDRTDMPQVQYGFPVGQLYCPGFSPDRTENDCPLKLIKTEILSVNVN